MIDLLGRFKRRRSSNILSICSR